MKTINLYFDFEFTSLSPDAQPISLGIVSEHTMIIKTEYLETLDKTKSYHFKNDYPSEKSFYSEFTDFDINRCDNWVKENVVSKLKYYGTPQQDKMFLDSSVDEGIYWGSQNTDEIKGALHKWLEQFSDYQIQFVCDCGTFDWYFMLQLLAEWDEVEYGYCDFMGNVQICKVGLPKLLKNISPVPQDLNDLILSAYLKTVKKDATAMEAFNVNRETLLYLIDTDKQNSEMYEVIDNTYNLRTSKHNALFDAKVIKAIYNILI